MNYYSELSQETGPRLSPLLAADAFSRLDESDDGVFYARDRMVEHLDARVLATVELIIGRRKPRPEINLNYGQTLTREELEERKRAVKLTLTCPYCGEKMRKWAVPENPFGQTWDNDYMYICFNDACDYYGRGWEVMHKQGNSSCSYRLMYDPVKDCCLPVPVHTPQTLKEGVCD